MSQFSTAASPRKTQEEKLRSELANQATPEGGTDSISQALANAQIPEASQRPAEGLGTVDPQGPTAAFQAQEEERVAQERFDFEQNAQTAEQQSQIQNLRGIANNPDATPGERDQAWQQLQDIADENRNKFDAEQQAKQEQIGIRPLTETRPDQFTERLLKEEQRVTGMKHLTMKTMDASEVASSFFNARDTLYEQMSMTDGSNVVANRSRATPEFNSSMDFYEKATGVKQPDIHANTAAVVWAKAAQTGIYASLGRDVEGVTAEDVFGDDANDSLFQDEDIVDTEAPAGGVQEVAKNYPKLKDVYTIMGREARSAANRQGFDYGVTDIEIGQQLFSDGHAKGLATVIMARNPGTDSAPEARVIFDKDFAFDLAPAGKILLPDLLKTAPTTPAVGPGFEGPLGRFVRAEKRGAKKKGVKLISTTAKDAATALGRVPFTAPSAELGFVDTMRFIASNNNLETGLLQDEIIGGGRTQKTIVEPATPLAGKARKNLSLDKKEPKAVGQNNARISRSINMMLENVARNVFARFSIGNNSERKYNTTRNANPTMFKEQRHVLRNGAPATVKKTGEVKIPTTDEALINFIKNSTGDYKAEANFLFTIGSVLGLDPNGNGDPRVLMKIAQNNMGEWARRGRVLADAFIGKGLDFEELVKKRTEPGTPVDPQKILEDPEVAAEIEKLINEGDDGDVGFRFTALIDAYLYSISDGRGFPSLAVGQLDLTAAGLTFMAKDAGSEKLLQSMGLIINVDTATGEAIVDYEGPRDIYMRHTASNIDEVFKGADLSDRKAKMKSLFQNSIMDPDNGKDFIKSWGKPPMMISPFGKHHATHQGTVLTFLSKKSNKAFLDAAKEIYGITEVNTEAFQELVEDLAQIHSLSLKKLFDTDAMYAITAINAMFAIGGETFATPGLDDETMVFGADKHEFTDTGQQYDGIEVPTYTGKTSYDPLARATSKTLESVNSKGEIERRQFTPDLMTAGKNTPLAALGHRRESSVLDEVTLDIADGKAVTPFLFNTYDSLGFDTTSALDVWLGMNVTGIKKAFDWEPQEVMRQAAIDQEQKTKEYLSNKDIVDISYPDGDVGALGFSLDKEYLSLQNQLAKIDTYHKKYQDELKLRVAMFKQIEAKTKWSPPEMTEDPNQNAISKQRNGVRMIASTAGRTMPTMSGKEALMLFNAWKKVSGFNRTLDNWTANAEKDKKRQLTKSKLDSRQNKLSYWAKPVSH